MSEFRSSSETATSYLDRYVSSEVPGLQYVVVAAGRILLEYAGGLAEVAGRKAMMPDTTLTAYSMTKTFTAVAILQLVERGKLSLDDVVDQYLPSGQYRGHGITLRQLLAHTSGIPNPIPLRWVHAVEEHASFDETAALAAVLRENPKLVSEPGRKFAYSNIGYWLLGKVIEQVVGQSYQSYMKENILRPLGLSEREMGFAVPDNAHHAAGYLAKYSFMNLVKGFVVDRQLLGNYEGRWLRLKALYVNGPAFGGLIGTARGFSRFLQDQLRSESVLFGAQTKRVLHTQQTDSAGRAIPMTPGWHIGETGGVTYFFKEGGGGGFHCEMRVYPAQGVASVVMANSTGFNSTRLMNRVDRAFLAPLR